MPELPEVETIRVQIEPLLLHRSITEAWSHPSSKFVSATKAIGHQINAVKRRGKYLIITLTPAKVIAVTQKQDAVQELIIHLGMTGRLSTGHPAEVDFDHPHLRAWWHLHNNTIFTFHDIRRFGRISVVASGRYETIPGLHRLGPEPFSEQFTGQSLWQALQASRRHLKTQLLSQRPVAGLGNIYADEALWMAGINPVVRRLSLTRSEALAQAIRAALSSGLRHGGTTLRDYVTVMGLKGRNQHHLYCYGRAGHPCERCGILLQRRVVDARGTTWCPQCQRY